MSDVFNEDYRGCWILVCKKGGQYTAFIDKEPIPLHTAFSTPDELLAALRRRVDVEKAEIFNMEPGHPIPRA